MPTYEYECTRCGYVFEAFQKINSPPRKRCPKCHGKVKRLISGGCGLIFKGSGFYITDYKKKPQKEEKKKEGKKESLSPTTENKNNT